MSHLNIDNSIDSPHMHIKQSCFSSACVCKSWPGKCGSGVKIICPLNTQCSTKPICRLSACYTIAIVATVLTRTSKEPCISYNETHGCSNIQFNQSLIFYYQLEIHY